MVKMFFSIEVKILLTQKETSFELQTLDNLHIIRYLNTKLFIAKCLNRLTTIYVRNRYQMVQQYLAQKMSFTNAVLEN